MDFPPVMKTFEEQIAEMAKDPQIHRELKA